MVVITFPDVGITADVIVSVDEGEVKVKERFINVDMVRYVLAISPILLCSVVFKTIIAVLTGIIKLVIRFTFVTKDNTTEEQVGFPLTLNIRLLMDTIKINVINIS